MEGHDPKEGSNVPVIRADRIRAGSGPPLPEKIPTEGKDPRSRAAGYAYGWNDCLEEIKRRSLQK